MTTESGGESWRGTAAILAGVLIVAAIGAGVLTIWLGTKAAQLGSQLGIAPGSDPMLWGIVVIGGAMTLVLAALATLLGLGSAMFDQLALLHTLAAPAPTASPPRPSPDPVRPPREPTREAPRPQDLAVNRAPRTPPPPATKSTVPPAPGAARRAKSPLWEFLTKERSLRPPAPDR